ncbi:MAG: hypothetical protein KJ949_03305 [Nanoarchaeota archaeon]|nr:hypothetical protein [Nanoarchaeota archaeon]
MFERILGYTEIRIVSTLKQNGEISHVYSGKLNHNSNSAEPILRDINESKAYNLPQFKSLEKSIEATLRKGPATKTQIKIKYKI